MGRENRPQHPRQMLRSMEFSFVSSGPGCLTLSLAWSSLQARRNFSCSGDGARFGCVPSKAMRTVTLCRSSFGVGGRFRERNGSLDHRQRRRVQWREAPALDQSARDQLARAIDDECDATISPPADRLRRKYPVAPDVLRDRLAPGTGPVRRFPARRCRAVASRCSQPAPAKPSCRTGR